MMSAQLVHILFTCISWSFKLGFLLTGYYVVWAPGDVLLEAIEEYAS